MNTEAPTLPPDTYDLPARDGWGSRIRFRILRHDGALYALKLWEYDPDEPDPDDEAFGVFLDLKTLGEIGGILKALFPAEQA